MKCVSCHLENPQSRELCYRCSHPLDLSFVDVNPPRQTRISRLRWQVRAQATLPRLSVARLKISRSRLFVWLVSALPGTGHMFMNRWRWAGGLGLAWLVVCLMGGSLTLRPSGLVMMVQCFAMSDAYRLATERQVGMGELLAVNLVSAIVLAGAEMIFMGMAEPTARWRIF